MVNLLTIEYKKIVPFVTFWVIFGLIFLLTPLVFYAFGQIEIQGLPVDFATVYKFPYVWNNITYIASWFNLLLGMCVVILVCNEFSFKTFRQHVIDGQSKVDFVISKILLMFSFALVATFYMFIVGSLFGMISGSAEGTFFTDIKFIAIYFIQALAYMSVGMIIAVLIRSMALSIIIFLFSIFIEFIIRLFIPHPIDKFFPMKIISNLTPFPVPKSLVAQQIQEGTGLLKDEISLNTTVFVAVVYVLVFWGLTYFILRKKDIR